MRFVICSHSRPGADRTGFEAEEYRMVDVLHSNGFFEQIYVRGDGYGAISIIDAESEAAVREQLAKLPFAVNGCVEIESVLDVTPRW